MLKTESRTMGFLSPDHHVRGVAEPEPETPTLEIPHDLSAFVQYRVVWALCDFIKHDKRLKATHYACVMFAGRDPVWGVFSIAGRFVHLAGSRAMIERRYSGKAWRRKSAAWTLAKVEELTSPEQRKALKQALKA